MKQNVMCVLDIGLRRRGVESKLNFSRELERAVRETLSKGDDLFERLSKRVIHNKCGGCNCLVGIANLKVYTTEENYQSKMYLWPAREALCVECFDEPKALSLGFVILPLSDWLRLNIKVQIDEYNKMMEKWCCGIDIRSPEQEEELYREI